MSKQGDNRRIARRVISLGPTRLRNLLFVPVIIAWSLLGVGPGLCSMRRRNHGTRKTVPYGISL